MILLLGNYSKSWSMNDCSSPTGSQNKTDSILVPVDYLKAANYKMILSNIRQKKIVLLDSIINLQQQKINVYDDSYNKMKDYAVTMQKLNESLNNDISKYKKRNKVLGGVAGGLAASLILFIIIK